MPTISSSVPRKTGIRLYPLWAKTSMISSRVVSSAMATISVRGVMTSRTGRSLKVITPGHHGQFVVGDEALGGAFPQDRAQFGRPAPAAGRKHRRHDRRPGPQQRDHPRHDGLGPRARQPPGHQVSAEQDQRHRHQDEQQRHDRSAGIR